MNAEKKLISNKFNEDKYWLLYAFIIAKIKAKRKHDAVIIFKIKSQLNSLSF